MIRVENLTKYYGTRLAVDNISFNIEKGEIVGFLGPNAAGKTTTMRILTGFLAPTRGDVWIAGYDMLSHSLEARQHIGYFPESVPLYTDMTVRSYLDFSARLRGLDKNKIKTRIEDVVEICHLEVNNLRTYFYTQEGEVKAVDGLSYHVNKGESVGLVGESACGKSVSALSIMRLIPYPPGIIMGGEIIFKGQDLQKFSEEDMRHVRGNQIGMIFQEPMTSLNPVLTIRLQIAEALELHRGMDKETASAEVIRLLRLVGIPDAEKRTDDYPHQFSGGMQQRIMIAMALSCSPDLLIADEPTTSVDVTVQAQLLELLANMRSEFGTAIIVITHNLGLVARYVDRVCVMYAGRLVETGPTDAIYEEPKHPYTNGLISSVPRLDLPRKRKLHVIEGLPPHLAYLPKGCSFAPRCYLANDKCREEKPELEKVGENHFSACFRSKEVKQEAGVS